MFLNYLCPLSSLLPRIIETTLQFNLILFPMASVPRNIVSELADITESNIILRYHLNLKLVCNSL